MQEYRFKFYLNAIHSIEINGVMGMEHPHTWEIGIDAFKGDNSFVMFSTIEIEVENLFSTYQNQHLNNIAPFDTVNPTLENVSLYFKVRLEQLLVDNGWVMTKLEVSETPSRTFIIDMKNTDDDDNIIDNVLILDTDKFAEVAANSLINKNFASNTESGTFQIESDDFNQVGSQNDIEKFLKNARKTLVRIRIVTFTILFCIILLLLIIYFIKR